VRPRNAWELAGVFPGMRRVLRHPRMGGLRLDGNQVHQLGERPPQADVCASGLLDPLCVLPVIPDGGNES
jgi:hypothetical protein